MNNKLFFLLLLLLFIHSVSAFAFYGARPMGMGGAYTAVADDASAAYWNPAGFALNPGVDLMGTMVIDKRNVRIGDNMAALKMCYEAELGSPFEWIIGVGMVSQLALQAAQTLSDTGVLKKNWGREGEKTSREDSMADQVAAGQKQETPPRKPLTDVAPRGSITVVYPWYYPWYHFNAYHPTYWDDRYKSTDPLISPKGKAQFAIGFTWLYDNNQLLNQDTNWYTISVATGWEERVAVGGNINIYDLKETMVGGVETKGFGGGIDLGVLGRPTENFTLGMMIKEILTTDIKWQNGAATRYEMMLNMGVAFRPIDRVTLATDVHNFFGQNNSSKTFHLGAEVRPAAGIALRCGLDDNNKTAGASLALGPVIADYTMLGGTYGRTQTVGLTWKL